MFRFSVGLVPKSPTDQTHNELIIFRFFVGLVRRTSSPCPSSEFFIQCEFATAVISDMQLALLQPKYSRAGPDRIDQTGFYHGMRAAYTTLGERIHKDNIIDDTIFVFLLVHHIYI